MSSGYRMKIRDWSWTDWCLLLPFALFCTVFGGSLLYVGFVAVGVAGILNPAWMFIVIAVLQFRWLFKMVPTWDQQSERVGSEALTEIARQAAYAARGEFGGPDGALRNGYTMPGAVICTYTRTLRQRAFGHIPVQVTAGVDRNGNVLVVDYHLEDVTYSAGEMGMDWPSEEE